MDDDLEAAYEEYKKRRGITTLKRARSGKLQLEGEQDSLADGAKEEEEESLDKGEDDEEREVGAEEKNPLLVGFDEKEEEEEVSASERAKRYCSFLIFFVRLQVALLHAGGLTFCLFFSAGSVATCSQKF